VANSQSRSQLEEERSRIIEEIERTSSSLKQTSKSKKTTLKDLKAIENQIRNRKKLIENIQNQIKSADEALASNSIKIDSLVGGIAALDKQYEQIAKSMYLRKLAGSKWAYIFSASSVNDAFLRWRYTKQFEAFVSQKTTNMNSQKENISDKSNSILVEKEYVESLLADEKKNYKKLEQDLAKKDEILEKLKGEESKLKKDLNKRKKDREKLNKEIEKIILAELTRNRATIDENALVNLTKKGLPWPTKGYISGKFGNQAHPTLRNVRVNNNGIDITSRKSAPVSVVYDGKVISVTSIPGYDNMVIVQHGNYYSVYSKLAHIIVKTGEEVRTGQTLGRLNDIESAELHFEFWKGKTKLDPEEWLK